jgi:membrane-bound lytic murein transglycosylase B
VIELDRKQPEFTRTFGAYLSGAVSERRVRDGQAMLAQHRTLLNQIAAKYGVQPHYLVAFWGLETNYGSNFGGFSVIETLATLAHDPRRSAFFRRELMTALHILDQGHIAPQRMVGSWAGAMGNLQFMPSTFRAHAVDEDGDGHADIWGSLPDTFASAAKYLADEGWRGDESWGREVQLPPNFDYMQADLSVRKPLADWAALGVRNAQGGALPVVAGMEGSILVPAGAKGPAFIVYQNFRTTMVWNRSISYALAVGYLADRLQGEPPLVHAPSTSEQSLRRADVMEMQERLNALGFQAGKPDGLAGSRTRAAIRDFQQARGLIPDAYPSQDVLIALRQAENG